MTESVTNWSHLMANTPGQGAPKVDRQKESMNKIALLALSLVVASTSSAQTFTGSWGWSLWQEPSVGVRGSWFQGQFSWIWKPSHELSPPGAMVDKTQTFHVLKRTYNPNHSALAYLDLEVFSRTPTGWTKLKSPGNWSAPPSRGNLRAPYWHSTEGINVTASSNIPNKHIYYWAKSPTAATVFQPAQAYFTPGSQIPGVNNRYLVGVYRWGIPFGTSLAFFDTLTNSHGYSSLTNVPFNLYDVHAVTNKVLVAIDPSGSIWKISTTTQLGPQAAQLSVQPITAGSAPYLLSLGGKMPGKVFGLDWGGDIHEVNITLNNTVLHAGPAGRTFVSTPVSPRDGTLYAISTLGGASPVQSNSAARVYLRQYNQMTKAWLPWAPLPALPGATNDPVTGFGVPRLPISITCGTYTAGVWAGQRVVVSDQSGRYWMLKTNPATGAAIGGWSNLGTP